MGTDVPSARASRLTLAVLGTWGLLAAYAAAGGPAASADSSGLDRLGRQLFFDPALSASGRLSCASCHNPEHAYGPPNGRSVQLGGLHLDREGARAVPSLRYVLNRTPVWSKPYIANPAERLLEGNSRPAGGFGWDGRFNSLCEQAMFPLFNPNEMANSDIPALAQKLRQASYADELRRLFGTKAFRNPDQIVAAALAALERFELDDPSFHPYTSQYDVFLEGKASLTDAERRGLALFNDPKRGNCASCHVDTKGADGSHPLFTDYQFEALGVPRNPELLANANPDYFDLGVCGPLRKDQQDQLVYCGSFKTPTLRNVATRAVFFHNGRFHRLKEALQFYVSRDADPQHWYPSSAAGLVTKSDDLPAPLRSNVDVIDEPLTRHAGQPPVWSDDEIDDVIEFLQTLTDSDAIRGAPY